MDSSCLQGDQGAVVDAAAELPRPPARPPELIGQQVRPHGGRVPHGAQPKAPHGRRDRRGEGEEVDGVGRQERSRVVGDPGRAVGRAGPCRHEGGKLGVPHADPRAQVLRHGVQESADEAGLAAVELLQAVQADVGRARLRPLHPVADPLQGGEDLLVHPLVGGLVGLQDGGVGVAGQGLLQGHPRGHSRGGGEGVDDHGPPPGAVDDDGGGSLQLGLSSQLDLGPEVGDEHAGDLHGGSLAAWSGGKPWEGDDREHMFSRQLAHGAEQREAVISDDKQGPAILCC